MDGVQQRSNCMRFYMSCCQVATFERQRAACSSCSNTANACAISICISGPTVLQAMSCVASATMIGLYLASYVMRRDYD
jgi:hypothetical protein